MKIDNKDMKILSILDWDGRIPISKLSKQIHLNKDVIRYRINNLEKNKILEGYYTIVNISKLGYLSLRIYFDFNNINKIIEEKIINHLDKKFNAGQIFSIDGDYQLGIICWEKSVYNLYKKLIDFKKEFGNFLNKQNMSIFISLNHYPRKYLKKNFNEIISIKEENKVKIKEEDIKILKELAKNARISSVDLSTKLKIPQTTIINRIRQLCKENIILGYRANINIEKMGFQNYYLEIFTNNSKEIEDIIIFLKTVDNCVYSCQVIPGADVEIEVEFKNKPELLEFINELKEKFNTIKKIKYWSTLKYHKINYLPRIK